MGKGATRWVVMSRHYYNPTHKAGVVDYGTGYTITYTPTLRPKVGASVSDWFERDVSVNQQTQLITICRKFLG